jgi:hypothetical protein
VGRGWLFGSFTEWRGLIAAGTLLDGQVIDAIIGNHANNVASNLRKKV